MVGGRGGYSIATMTIKQIWPTSQYGHTGSRGVTHGYQPVGWLVGWFVCFARHTRSGRIPCRNAENEYENEPRGSRSRASAAVTSEC